MQDDSKSEPLVNEPPVVPESNGATSGGDVLSLIADVERHLDRIRNVQSKQETEYADLAARQRRLAEAEAGLADRRTELDELAVRLAEAQAATDDARAAVEREREGLDARWCEVQSEADALADVRRELDDLRSDLDRRADDLDARSATLAEDSEALGRRASELEQASRSLAAQVDAAEAARAEAVASLEDATRNLAEREAEVNDLRLEIESRANALDAVMREKDDAVEALRVAAEEHDAALVTANDSVRRHRDAIEAVGRELDTAQSELDSMRTDLAAAIERAESAESTGRDAESARQALDETVARLEGRCGELDGLVADREATLVDLQARISQMESVVTERDGRIAELEARTEQDQQQLRLAGSKLAELAHVVAEQAPRLERGSEAMALVGELEAEVERLRREAASSPGVDLAAVRGPLEARIVELESELARLRGEVADQASFEQALADATAPFQARVADLESALEAARRSAGDVDADALASAIESARAPLEARITELEQAAATGDAATIEAAVETATATLRAELEQARAEAAGGDVPRAKYENVKEKCRRAERRSDELETALSLANDRGQAQEMAKRLRAKAERVGDLARHLERRKARLVAVRTAMRQRAALAGGATEGAGGTTFHELQRLEAQRRELEQVRDFLARSERQMVRRWARPRSVSTIAWILLLACFSAAAGWVATTRLMPLPGTATVTLTAATTNGQALSPEAAEAWETWHQALATDPAFLDLVMKRLAARGLAPSGGEAALASLLADDLVFENEGHGRLRMALRGDDSRILEATLDAVAATMASESARQAPRRIDGARATLPTERASSGGIGYATLVAGHWGPETLSRMGMVAGGVFGGAMLLILITYGLLSRSKRVFEESEGGEDLATGS